MTTFLPPDYRCSAYWYALRSGTLTGHWESDLEFLRELGWHAASMARWYGIPEWPKIQEGPNPVYFWPEWIWSAIMDQLANYAAEHGQYCPDPSHGRGYRGPDEPGHGYWEAGDY